MKKEILFLILLVIVVITSCTIIPGSDQWKIRLAATNYVESKQIGRASCRERV